MGGDTFQGLMSEIFSLYDAVEFHQTRLVNRDGYEARLQGMTEREGWKTAEEELRKSRAVLEQRRTKLIAILERLKTLYSLSPEKEDGLAADIPWGMCHMVGDIRFSFPWKRRIPFQTSFSCAYTEKNYAFVKDVILNLILRSGHGAVHLFAVDIHGLGQEIRPLRPLLNKGDVMTHLNQTEKLLNELTYKIADFYELAGHSNQDWNEYKRNNPQDRSPYIVLLVLNAQEIYTKGSATLRDSLERVLRMGPSAGIVTFLLSRKEECTPKQLEEFTAFLKRSKVRPLLKSPAPIKKTDGCSITMTWDVMADGAEGREEQKLREAVHRMQVHLPTLTNLWQKALPPALREQGLCIPIGWNAEDGLPAILTIGDTTPHCFIGGQTGSGKSNLLHVILHSLLAHYRADELQLYLLDFKQGVEMKQYADAHPGAVSCVATQSDREFADSLLRYLLEENKRRIELFPPDVNNISKYNQRAEKKLPRIVLLVDECQHLFQQGSYRASDNISKLTEQLVRQGRSQGIHLILSTQTLSGMDIGNKSLWNNIPARVALFCKASDSASILASDNPAAAYIQSPGQAVLNLQNGNKEANIIVNVPKLQPEMEEFGSHLQAMQTPGHQVHFYNGITHYPLPSSAEFAGMSGMPQLYVGYCIDYHGTPFRLPLFDEESESCTAMVVTWGTPSVRRAMRQAMLQSAAASHRVQHVYYISKMPPPDFGMEKICFVKAPELTDELIEEIFCPTTAEQQKFIYIQDWDMISALEIPSGVAIRPSAKVSPFKKALDSCEDYNYVHIVAEVKSPGNSSMRTALKTFRQHMVQGIPPKDAASFIGMDLGSSLPQVGTDEQHRNNVVLSNRGSISMFRGFSCENEA